MASVNRSISGSGVVAWNTTNRLWTLSDLFNYVPGPTTRLTITSTQSFITPTHPGATNPAGNLRVGFSVDTTRTPTGGWKASNPFTLTITLDDGRGVATNTLTTQLIIVAPPRVVNPIPAQTIPASATGVQVVDLDFVFLTTRYGLNPTKAYTVASATGGIVANISAEGVLTLNAPATAGSGRVQIRCTTTSESRAPASLTASATDTFAVTVTGAVAPSVTTIPQFYLREGEQREYDLTPYLMGTNPRVDTAEVTSNASVRVEPLGASVLVTGLKPVANKDDNTVTLSIIGDAGSAVSATFTASVLAGSVLFDGGAPFLSVNASRLLTVTAPGVQRVPATPYTGYTQSFQIEAFNDTQSVYWRTSTFPSTQQLPDGGQWTVRMHMFLDGFSARNTRETRVNAPPRAVGQIVVTSSTRIVLVFVYGSLTAADVTDLKVRLYGDDYEEFDPAPTQPTVGSPVFAAVTPSKPGVYQVVVECKVRGEPVRQRETVVFGSPETRMADGPSLTIGGKDYTESLARLAIDGGVNRSKALPVLRSMYARINLETDDMLTEFEGKEIVFKIGDRRFATLWTRGVSETLGPVRQVVIDAYGASAARARAEVAEAGGSRTQSDILHEVAEQAEVSAVDYAEGVSLPPHKHIETFNFALTDLLRYDGFICEDRFGRVQLGESHIVPYDLVIGVDAGDQIAVNEVQRPRAFPYNSVDTAAQTIDAEPLEVSTTDTDGNSPGIEFTLLRGFDITTRQPSAASHTLTRAGLSASVAPATDGMLLRGEHYRRYSGDEVVKLTTQPMQLPSNIPSSDLPPYVTDEAVLRTRANDLLQAIDQEDRESVRVDASLNSARLDAISYMHTGALVRYRGDLRRIDALRLEYVPGEFTLDLLLAPRFGALDEYLTWSQDDWGSKPWA